MNTAKHTVIKLNPGSFFIPLTPIPYKDVTVTHIFERITKDIDPFIVKPHLSIELIPLDFQDPDSTQKF